MKAFVYEKSIKCHKMQVITDVEKVVEDKARRQIIFQRAEGFDVVLDTRRYKSTIYQN